MRLGFAVVAATESVVDSILLLSCGLRSRIFVDELAGIRLLGGGLRSLHRCFLFGWLFGSRLLVGVRHEAKDTNPADTPALPLHGGSFDVGQMRGAWTL